MKNKQPFYHRATILFTATREITREELQEMLVNKLKSRDIVQFTQECEEIGAEPGDPADLM